MKKHVKPPLGEIIRLHQAYEWEEFCLYCGRPVKVWNPMEKCQGRYKERVDNL